MHDALHPRRVHDGAVVLAALRQGGCIHADRPKDALFEQGCDRSAVAALEYELKQHVTGMAVDALLAGRLAGLRLPGVEHVDELRPRERVVRPGWMVGRQQDARRVRGELANGDAADIVSGELGQIFRQGIVEPQFTPERAQRHQRRLERFAQRTKVEQRIWCDRSSCGVVGEAVVEELDMAAGIERGGEAARLVRRHGRRQLVGDDVAHLRDHVGIRGCAARPGKREGNERSPGERPPGEV
ncbi:hypothetical protein ABIF67_011626 [Bradyrhizobium japonicum]